jgi:hypothetical protein
MFDSINLPRVEKVKASTPLSDLEAFDMMSRFLAAEKAKAIDLDFAGQSYLASSSQVWNDLRMTCNSLLEDNDPRREPVTAWKDDADFALAPSLSKSILTSKSTNKTDKEAERSAKKEKKEAKKAKKEAKKIKKEAKKAKKEAKKRKRDSPIPSS